MLDAFYYFDTNRSGYLDYRELREALAYAGLDLSTEAAKEVVKAIKAEKLKVQAQVQDDQVRVSGKKRDDLQAVMALLKDLGFRRPLQFVDLRD